VSVRPRGRITAALVGLVLLVLAGWFVREQVRPHPPALPTMPGVSVGPSR
jgi:hypothetical protein